MTLMSSSSENLKRTAQEQFDRQAAHYDTQWNSWSAHTLRWMVERAECAPADIVLDIATGTGFTALEFAGLVKSVTAVDVSSGMLDQARRRAEDMGVRNVDFAVAPAEKLPFGDESFDIVTCRIAAHHFLNVADFVAESARVLRPGGRFLLVDTTVPDDDSRASAWQNAVEAARDPSHVENLSPLSWRRLVDSAGLTVVEATDAGEGIDVPLDDWIAKAGCSPEQAAEVRRRFAEAPGRAREAFRIRTAPDGAIVFTWRRLLLKAIRYNK
jgi:ubiquinone/menaquinone biosynthesis C-methylase UbiE